MTTRTRVAALAGALLLAVPGAAQAAEPAKGTIDSATPTAEFTGEAAGTAVQYAHFFYGAQLVDDCVAPMCDTFTVTVGEAAKKITIAAEDETGYTEMQVKDAAGNEVFWSEGVEAGPTVFSKTNVKAGTVYTVEILTDALAPSPLDDPSFFATATFTPVTPPPATAQG